MAPRRNKPIVKLEGFAMRFKKRRKRTLVLERRAKCDAVYSYDPATNTFTVEKDHVRHDEDSVRSDTFLARQDLKEMANHGRPREVINAVRKKYPPLVSIATGSYNAKRKIIYKAKGVKDDDTMEMDRGGDVAPQFARTLNGERFLVKDSTIQTATGASRMVVFASDFGLDLLADSRTVFCDGTFDAVPSPFTQLFTIHAYVSESVVRPVVFCLLSDKQTASYEAVLKIVSESHPRLTVWEPLLVICDFEIALKNAFRSQFPRTCVQGCLFHLLQSWRRKAEQLHIYEEFTKGSIKDFWARLKSIPFIDASQTKQFFDLIVATVAMPIPQNIQDFIDYLSRFYIESTDRFPPSMWSVVDRTMNGIHRTTNVVETWHKMLTYVFSKKNGLSPVLMSDLLMKVKEEEEHTRMDAEELRLDPNFQVNRSRRLSNVMKDKRLIKALENSPLPPNAPLTGIQLLDSISMANSS